ncbi:NADH-quinone oxidoreductase subunit L [bacterium]|nr:NADH-quinone oxidoreductase subunit L [bacterium]
MQNLILDNITLTILIPLWIFLIIMAGRFFSVYVNQGVTNILTLLSSLFGFVVSLIVYKNIGYPLDWSITFIRINDFVIDFGIRVDRLSVILLAILFFISFCVQLYSVSYMKEKTKNYRFFALLNLFNFAMSFLILSPNLFQFYVFWELVGVVSYLLIGFDYEKQEKSNASRRVFLVNRIGDVALISAIIFSSYFMYNYAGNKTFVSLSFEDFNAISVILSAYTSQIIFISICVLFLLAAMVKSAQFPFHTWLQDAMEAELPVSALLHSATMVIAGVYLLTRLVPIFDMNGDIYRAIILIGIITAIMCSIMAILEKHPKKILAYSTSANLGLMFMALGLGNIKAVVILLIAHALMKSSLFLLLPHGENKTFSYTEFYCFCISGLSLCGLILLGFSAKEYSYILINNIWLKYLYTFASILGAFYITKLAISLYGNAEKGRKIKPLELISVLFIIGTSILLYFKIKGWQYSLGAPFYCSICGIVFILILEKLNLLSKIGNCPKIIENINNVQIVKLYEGITNLACNIERVIYSLNIIPKKILLCGVVAFNWIEVNILNRFIKLVAECTKMLSKLDMKMQTKNIQTYNAYAFIFITLILALIIIAYKLILGQVS